MSVRFGQNVAVAHLPLPEASVETVKGALRKADNDSPDPHRVLLGACMREVQHAFVLTLKEFARELKKDERQLERQMEGRERPQIELVLANQKFQGPMLIALARITPGVAVDTVVHIRRAVV